MYALVKLCLIITITFFKHCVGENVTNGETDDEREALRILDARKLLIKDLFEHYDSRIAPTGQAGGSANISVQLFITSIDTISETNMDFAISMFLRQRWYDRRLVHKVLVGHDKLELDAQTMTRVWVPDLFIPSEKKALVHDVTVPNKLMHVYPDGKIQYSLRLSATLKCNFNLRKFPMDHQHCAVEMESYGYTTEILRFSWTDDPISYSDDMQIPQFFLQDITTSQCDKVYYGVGYSCVRFDIYMERSKGYYITQVFIPSYLIVFLSWVSFWLDIDAVPARISLGLLTVLTMTTQSAGARNNLPKVSYVKAIDIWMAACLLFVFMALVQFAYVNVLSRVAKRRKLNSTDTVGKFAFMPSVGTPTGMMSSTPTSPVTPGSIRNANPGSPFMRMRRKGDLDTVPSDGEDREASEKSKRIDNGTSPTKPSFALIASAVKTMKENDDLETGDPEQQAVSRNRRASSIQIGFADVVKKAQTKMNALVSQDREKARNADRISRVLFPLVFLVFNIVYWCFYIFWEPTEQM